MRIFLHICTSLNLLIMNTNLSLSANAKQQTEHDIRNLLGNISSLAELVMLDIDDANKTETTKQTVEMLKQLSNEAFQIFEYRLKPFKNGQRNMINPVELLTHRCLFLYPKSTAGKHIHFTFSLPETNVKIRFDDIDFLRVADNLLSNAIKFSHPKATVHLSGTVADNLFTVAVQDTGIGIPSAFQPYIFQSNGFIKREGTANEYSTGIGLSIVQRLVTENGGKVWFKSKENEGSTFYFSVPVCQSEKYDN